MEYTVSNRMEHVKGSIIRDLFKLASDPGIVQFGGGNPSAESFPVKEIAEITAEALQKEPIAMLQYSLSEGYPALRKAVAAHLAESEKIDCTADNIIVVSGAQQGADLVTKLLVNEGDTVLCEDPSFVGCLNAFRSYGANLVGIPMESDGVSIEKLEEALKREKNVRFLYLIPSFQNPTGITTSLQKRKKILDLAKKYNILIFEDNPYGELRFSGESVPAIKSMDTEGRVIYCGSFSKVMAPAFRVGFLCMEEDLLGRFEVGKQVTDVHTNVLFQHICAKYMTDYDFKKHISDIREIYRHKAELMLSEIEKNFHPSVAYNRPEGGLFIMAYLPEGMDSQPFTAEGVKRGVCCVPGVAFLADANAKSNGFRLNYSTPSDEDIVRGIGILGKLTHEWVQKE